MIYCKLKEEHATFAIYQFGMSTEDMSGEAIIYSSFIEPKILKHPIKRKASQSWLNRVVIKYKKDLFDGHFPDRMSYEI